MSNLVVLGSEILEANVVMLSKLHAFQTSLSGEAEFKVALSKIS